MAQSLKQENMNLHSQNPHGKAMHGRALLSLQCRGRGTDRRILGTH